MKKRLVLSTVFVFAVIIIGFALCNYSSRMEYDSSWSNILKSKELSSQYQGGIWKNTQQSTDVLSNGSFIVSSITYKTHEFVENEVSNRLDFIANISYLVALTWLGIFVCGLLFGLPRVWKSGIACLLILYIMSYASTNKALNQAHQTREGIMQINYRIFYNGSWTSFTTQEVWDTASKGIIYVPDSEFGIGTYTSY